MSDDFLNAEAATSLSGEERAAVILLALGKEAVRPVAPLLSESELRSVARAGAELGDVPPDTLDAAIAAFEREFQQPAALRADATEFQALLSEAVSRERMATILGDKPAGEDGPWAALAQMPPARLALRLQSEHPQTLAQIMTRLGSKASALALEAMPAALRNDVLQRMMTLEPLDDALAQLLAEAARDILTINEQDARTSQRERMVASVINNLDSEQAELALRELGERNPAAARALKSKMFRFEDVPRLGEKDRGVLLEAISSETLVAALCNSDAALRDQMLSSLAARARRIVESELASAVVAPKDVLKAQRDIAEKALALADKGKLELPQEPAPDGAG